MCAGNLGGGGKMFFLSGPKCPPSIGFKIITDRLILFRNLLDNYCYRTVTDSDCLGIHYGLRYRLRNSVTIFLWINYGIANTDFNFFGINYDDRYRYRSRL